MKPVKKAAGKVTPAAVPALDAAGLDAPGPSAKMPETFGKSAKRMWQEPSIARLISSLIGGKIERLDPEIDLCLKDGFVYREADSLLGTTGRETSLVLESIAKEGLLLKEDFRTMLVCPSGSVQLMPVERCPYCDSEQVTRGQLVEHFNCGHIGLEEEFVSGLKQVCPKCRRELKLIGTDYRKPGARYVCNVCHEIFAAPVIKCRCLKTGEVFPLEELRRVVLYSYRLNEAHRKRLEFEFEPKKQLIDYLERLGYDVEESVKVQGRSGATHTIDLLASVDDPITWHSVAVGILAAANDETEVNIDALFSFDSKIYDTGIDNKVVIAVPRLTAEAARFAERQSIRVYSLDELRHLSLRQTTGAPAGEAPGTAGEISPYLAKLGPRGWLRWLLERKGYHVEEKYKLKGRSGTEHVIDFYAQKDDGIMNHAIAACILSREDNPANDSNAVIKFDSAAYDAGIRDKVIISVPRLSKEARQFADYQRIKIIEARDLADFSRQYVNTGDRADVAR
jgi:hypothetical protein